MNKEELFELTQGDFVRQLVCDYQDGVRTDWDDMEGMVREYSKENEGVYGYDYDEVLTLLYRELERKGL